jgi:glycosyltransferase involved in cell wall biosynthesis
MATVLVPSASYILSDYLLSSEGTQCYNFFKHMAKYGYQFHAISNYIRIKQPLPNVKFYQVGTFEGRANIAQKYLAHLEFLTKGTLKALKILRKERIDIIHHMLPAVYNQTFSPLAILNTSKPFIFGPVSSHIAIIFQRPLDEIFFEPLTVRLHEETVKKCHTLIAITHHVKKLYKNLVGEEKVQVIPFGVDIHKFKPQRKDKESGMYEILYVGSLYPIKGLKYLIQALALVLKNRRDVKLRIVGSGPDETRLFLLAKRLGVLDNVSFEGFIPHGEIVRYYQQCNIFVYTTLGEPFGKSIIEAMACGKPVITSNIGGPAEIVEDGKTGFLVPPTKPHIIAEKIHFLLTDVSKRRQMGEAARKVAENYSWEKVAELSHRVYQSCL